MQVRWRQTLMTRQYATHSDLIRQIVRKMDTSSVTSCYHLPLFWFWLDYDRYNVHLVWKANRPIKHSVIERYLNRPSFILLRNPTSERRTKNKEKKRKSENKKTKNRRFNWKASSVRVITIALFLNRLRSLLHNSNYENVFFSVCIKKQLKFYTYTFFCFSCTKYCA